jgi:hypothetical protein
VSLMTDLFPLPPSAFIYARRGAAVHSPWRIDDVPPPMRGDFKKGAIT